MYLDTLDTQIFLWSSALKLAKKLTQLVPTSNKRSSSGEMKKRPEEGWYIQGKGLDTYYDQRGWTVKVNLHTFSGSSVIFDQCHMVWRAVAIKLQHMWMCLSHSRGDEGMTLLNSCQVLKSLACIEFFVANKGWPKVDLIQSQCQSLNKVMDYVKNNLSCYGN